MLFPVILAGCDDDTDDDLTDEHVDTSNESERAATDPVNDEDGGDGSCDIDDTSDASGQQGGSAACKTETLEDDGSVVNDCERRGQRMRLRRRLGNQNLLESIPVHCWKNITKEPNATRLKESLLRKIFVYCAISRLKML